jgi:hypothetical protein
LAPGARFVAAITATFTVLAEVSSFNRNAFQDRLATLMSVLPSAITLYISARNLKNLDVFTKSDPKCEVQEFVSNKWVVIGKTETINNNLNPDFKTSIPMSYYFEKIQKLKFRIIDSDD